MYCGSSKRLRSPLRRPLRRDARKGQAGFTLMELMVALVAGLIAITTIYSISSASARHFHEQQRVAQTQMSLRMAMMQIRDDFERAGLFGTPNSAREKRCRTPVSELSALSFQNNADTAVLPNAAVNGVTADRIQLTGAYATAASYMVGTTDNSGGTFFLQKSWQAFRRDFGVFGTSFRDDDFTDAFAAGRIAHIINSQGMHFFTSITGSQPASAAVTAQPIGVGGTCVGGLSDGALFSVLSQIEYAVVDPRNDPELSMILSPDTQASADARGLTPSVLVRRELDFQTGNPIAGTERVVLEYVADFDLEFILDTAVNDGAPPNLVRFSDAAAQAEVNANPHRVRSIIVSLSARTAGQEARFPFIARQPGDPLTRYQVNPQAPGAARVRTARAEIFLPNVAYRLMR